MELVFEREVNSYLPKNSLWYGFISYADSNFAKDLRDQRSVIGYCFFLNRVVILWNNKNQKIVSISITKVEYIALGHVAREAVWIRSFVNEMNLEIIKNVTLYGKNEMNITLTKNVES